MSGGTFFKWQLPSRTRDRKAQKLAKDANWREVVQAVNARDGYACRACGRSCNPSAVSLLEKAHHHHIEYRSAMGEDSTANVCLLCAVCHDDVHRHELHVELLTSEGANGPVQVRRFDADGGQWYVTRVERSVRQVLLRD